MSIYNKEIEDPTGQKLYVSGATPQDVNTAITSASLTPATPIKVPDAPTDDTNYDALIKGGQSAIDFYNKSLTEKEATTETTPDWLKQFLSGSAPSSTADLYKIEYESGGLDTLSQDTLAQQKALKTARGKLSSVSAQLAGITAEAQAVPIRLQKESEGRGITAGGLAPIQTAQLRDMALRALPLQAQAIAAQAEVEAAQGDVELSQNSLKLAQDKLATVFKLRSDDEERIYNHRKDQRNKVYDYLTAKEKTKLDSIQKEDDRKFTLMRDQLSNAQAMAKTAIESGQASLAAQITSLDPKSATYTQDLAALQGQIRPKPTSETAPTSYKEWELAGKPGTYADWLKEQNVKAPTIAQQTVAEYAARLEQANPIIEKLTPAINGMNVLSFEAQLRAIPSLQSAEIQQYKQAASNFINAKLRRESGAVISPSEFTEARAQYLPVPGDKPETLAQKKANRDLVYASLRKAAGNAYESVEDLMKGTDTTSTETSPKTIEYPLGSGKHYSVDAQGNMTLI